MRRLDTCFARADQCDAQEGIVAFIMYAELGRCLLKFLK